MGNVLIEVEEDRKEDLKNLKCFLEMVNKYTEQLMNELSIDNIYYNFCRKSGSVLVDHTKILKVLRFYGKIIMSEV